MWEIFRDTFLGYWRWLLHEISHPHWHNYFYWLIGISCFFLAWEAAAPWRKQKPLLHRDFWLDVFYLFFNFFLFSALGFAALSSVVESLLLGGFGAMGIESLALFDAKALPAWVHIPMLFFARDFVQWNIHRLLHRLPWLWQFHKVHHSAEELGFATHLRFHWMENVTYRSLEYIPLALLGYGARDLFIMHIIATSIGHWNHANIRVPLGPLRYLLNNPQMHRWHHIRDLPSAYGVNFGISLSLWDYLFGTAHLPHEGVEEPLGFEDLEGFPRGLGAQLLYPVGADR